MDWKIVCAVVAVASQAAAVEVPFQQRVVGMGEDEVQNVVAIDFDSDGDTDILSGSAITNRVVLFESDGAVLPVYTRVNIVTGAPGLVSFGVADMDGDGDLDIVTATGSDRSVSWHEQTPNAMPEMPPDFTRHIILTVPEPANIARVRVADMDGDGDPDVVYGGLTRFGWLDNDGEDEPMFTDRAIPTGNVLPQDFRVSDLNNDGDRDIVLCGTLGTTFLLWLESDGAVPPTFTEHPITSVLTMPRSLVIADINRDSALDIAVASAASDAVAWYESSGGGLPEFSEHLVTETLTSASSIVAQDLDSNGFVDLVVSSGSSNRVVWFDSSGSATPVFTEREIMGAGVSSPREIVAADADGDSDPDVIVASSGLDQVIYFANELAPVRNLTQGVVYQTIGEALLEARDNDEITVAAFRFPDEVVIDFDSVGATLRSSGAITQPKAGSYVLADGARLAASAPGGVTLVGQLQAPLGARSELGGAFVLNSDSSELLVDPGATLVLDDGATLTNDGVLDVLGGSVLADGAVVNTGDIAIIQGTLSGDTLDNAGMLTGSADIFADVTNAGGMTINADSLIAGALTNDGTVTIQNGVLTILGALTNNGTIVGDSTRGASPDGFFIDGTLLLGASSSLTLPAGAAVSLSGDFGAAIDDAHRFDLADAELRLTGVGPLQRVEAMSADVGADSLGLTRGPGRFPLGALSVGLTPAVVELVDIYDNDGAPGQEAVYTRRLTVAPGAELRTNGVRVYYQTLSLQGSVDTPANLIALASTCPADFSGDGLVDSQDLAALLAQWDQPGFADLNGDGIVEAGDLASVLAAWGPCP